MHIRDINQDRKDVIILLHPAFQDGSVMEEGIASALGSSFRYIIPDLLSHGESTDQFVSALEDTHEIHEYMEANGIENVKLAYGEGLGAVVLLLLKRYWNVEIERSVFSGVRLKSKKGLAYALSERKFLSSIRKAKGDREGSLRKLEGLVGGKTAGIMAENIFSKDDGTLRNIYKAMTVVEPPKLYKDDDRKMSFIWSKEDEDAPGNIEEAKSLYPASEIIVKEGLGEHTYITKDKKELIRMLERYL